MIVGCGQWLLAIFVGSSHGKVLVAELLEIFQHAIQVLFEMPNLHLTGMQALVACLHNAYDLGEVFLCGRGVLGGRIGRWEQSAGVFGW